MTLREKLDALVNKESHPLWEATHAELASALEVAEAALLWESATTLDVEARLRDLARAHKARWGEGR